MSHLFYRSRLARPGLERAEGIYLRDKDGRRDLEGPSGAIVSNIGDSGPAALAACDKGPIIHARRMRGGAKGDRFLSCPPMSMAGALDDELMGILTDRPDQIAAEAGPG